MYHQPYKDPFVIILEERDELKSENFKLRVVLDKTETQRQEVLARLRSAAEELKFCADYVNIDGRPRQLLNDLCDFLEL